MKVARADKEEFDNVYNFINIMDELFDSRWCFSQEENWKEWDENDPDKQLIDKIAEEAEREFGDCYYLNNLILFEFIKRKWKETNYCGSFQRIVTDAECLIDNVCDPDLDYLEFKPEYKEAIEEYNKKQTENNEI